MKSTKLKIMDWVFRVLFALTLVTPVMGIFGILPAPTRELYNTDIAFSFVEMLVEIGYISWIQAIVHTVVIILLFMKRDALAALLITPITVNIIGFHLFLDGGLFTPGAVMANILVVLNMYFLWRSREQYKGLWNGN
jgi:hypothetical protein